MGSEFQRPITGSVTGAAQTIDLSSPNSASEIVQITGTWVGTLIVEGSNDGVTYYTIDCIDRSTKLIITSITANGSFEADTNGFQFIQIRSSAWSSGTATINVYGSDATSFIETVSLLRGATDGTQIGNNGNKLLADVSGSPSLPLPTGAATSANQSSELTLLGAVTETAPVTDTASSGLNGRLQRIAQRLTSLIGLFPTSIGQKANAASLAVTLSTEQEAELGIVTETAPATDTASSGLNGRLQRIAQRLTSLIGLFPVSIGQKAMAGSLSVTIANDQTVIPDIAPVTQSITVVDSAVTSLVGANGQVFYTVTPTTNSAATFAVSSFESVHVQANILGGGGTLVVEVSMDGGTFWLRPNAFQPSTQNYTNSFTAPFIAVVNTTAITHIRVRAVTSWAGTATIKVIESSNSRVMTIGDSLPPGANVIGGVTQSGTWNINNITGTISLPTGASTEATLVAQSTLMGAVNETAPATDTTSSGQNGRLQRIAQRLTSLIALLPASLGQKASAASLAVTLSTEQEAEIGSVTETAPATDTASSGLNGRLQRIAQRLTSIIALLPTSLGQKTMANSFAVVLPSDQIITTTSSPLPSSGSGFNFGEIATSAITQVAVEATTYTEQTANSQMSIASSSANDTAAGTGARTVTIYYLDSTMTSLLTTTATLNGTSFVNLVTGMCYIEKIVVATVGSTGSNVGTLTLKATTAGGGATVGTVSPTINRTLWAHHYIPTGKTSYISGIAVGTNGSSAGQSGAFIARSATPTVANTPDIQISGVILATGAGNTVTRLYNSPIQISGPARIRIYVTPGATSAYTSFASFDYIDN